MKAIALAMLLAGLASIAGAATFTVTDPYPGTACSSPACDVIGDPNRFDIESLALTTSSAGSTTNLAVTLRFNYNYGDTTLSPFTDVLPLAVGDLLFHDASGNYLFGIPLNTHGGGAELAASNGGATASDPQVTQGTLYATSSSTGTNGVATAQQVLVNTNPVYRYNEPVWLRGGTAVATNTSFTSTLAPGSTNPNEVQVTIGYSLASNSAFLTALNGSSLFAQFASATCANDVLQGPLTATPEPVSFALMGSALMALGIWGRRRARS